VERPAAAISQAVTEFEFHISPASSSSRPHTGVGTVAVRSSSRRAEQASRRQRYQSPRRLPDRAPLGIRIGTRGDCGLPAAFRTESRCTMHYRSTRTSSWSTRSSASRVPGHRVPARPRSRCIREASKRGVSAHRKQSQAHRPRHRRRRRSPPAPEATRHIRV